MKNCKVWCSDQERLKEALEILEEKGYHWGNSETKPTEILLTKCGLTAPVGLFLEGKEITYCEDSIYFDADSLEEIYYARFLRDAAIEANKPKQVPTGQESVTLETLIAQLKGLGVKEITLKF